MGGSNPQELKSLGAPTNPRIKHLRGLHAKVYLSDKGLITSSANASNNGIGFLAVAKLVEAGSFHSPQSEAFRSAVRWFENIWNCASVVDEFALDQAEKAWERKTHIAGPLNNGITSNPRSLFDAVANDRARFRGVGFVFTTGNATVEDRDKAVTGQSGEEMRDKLLKC